MPDDVRDLLHRAVRDFEPVEESGPIRRRAKRRQIVHRAAAAAVALVVAVGGGIPAWQSLGGLPTSNVRPASEPLVVSKIPLPADPMAIAATPSTVWVALDSVEGRPAELLKINPATGEPVWSLPIGGEPIRISISGNDVWILDFKDNSLVRVDAQTASITTRIPMPKLPFEVARGDDHFVATLLAAYPDSVWVGSARGALARVDPETNAVTRVISLSDEAPIADVQATRDFLWVQGTHDTLAIDPLGGEEIIRLKSADGAVVTHLLATEGRVWVHIENEGLRQVWRADTGAVESEALPIPREAGPFAVVRGVIEVLTFDADDAGRADLRRIDPATLEFIGKPVPLPGVGPVASDLSGLWIADTDRSRLLRVGDGKLTYDSEDLQPQASPIGPTEPTVCPPPEIHPEFLPQDITRRPKNGPGPWQPDMAVYFADRSAVHHLSSSQGRFITIGRNAFDIVGPLLEEVHDQMRVMGSRAEIGAAVFGPLLTFTFGQPPCNRYWVTGSGITEKELRLVARSLRPTGTGTAIS